MTNNLDFAIAIINQHWQSGKKILEIGCGPAYLRKYYGTDYTGSDVTNDYYTPGVKRDVDVVCSAEDLKFEDQSFDIVLIKSAFYLFTNHSKALAEAYRLLRKGGVILILDYNKKTQKMLQKKEGHTRYPCWTQLGLKQLIARAGFNSTRLLLAETKQPSNLKRIYHLVRQEFLGTWAIVSGVKA